MNAITVCNNDRLSYTPESGFTYTDSYGERTSFQTAEQFQAWWAVESGGMDLDQDAQEFLENPWGTNDAGESWRMIVTLKPTCLMNPISGDVQTEQEWREDYATMDPGLWGGPEFEDANLIEVVKDENGQWVEA